MPLSNYPGGFNNGLVVRGMPVLNTYAGNIFWVDSGNGSDQNPGTFQRPFATIDYAIGRCTASNDDQIHVKAGHVEDLSAASDIDFDVAGVSVYGHGYGTTRPRIDWEAATATLVVDADNTRLVNLHMVASFAAVAEMLNVGAVEGFQLYNSTLEDESSALEFLEAVSLADGASGVVINGCKFIGRSTDNNAFIQFEGTCDELEIIGNSLIATAVQTATVALIDSASELTAAVIAHNVLVSQSATITGALVDTSTTTANSGMFAYNIGGVLDTDAANTQVPWDVTGMHMVENYVCDTVDTQGWQVPVIGATG
jgi:hypothetical protein